MMWTLCHIGVVNAATNAASKSARSLLSLDEFIRLAATRNTVFEAILIDELILKYQKDLRLPPDDLILSVKQQYEVYFSQGREDSATSIGLSQLFPHQGTEASLSYDVGSSLNSADSIGELSLSISQPIARNAFGRSTKLLDKIVGLEVDIARHQIVEAYEDYFAAITAAYYTWYEDYANLGIGQSSYSENLKLLDNIKKRQIRKIAVAIDVNKVELQVLSKKERVIELEEKLKSSLNVIQTIIRQKEDKRLIPVQPKLPTSLAKPFDSLYKEFSDTSRTFQVLKILEQKSVLQVARDADDLLPSINVIAGYEVRGKDYNIENSDDFFYAGVSVKWPFTNKVASAEHQVSKILADKSQLTTQNTYFRLYTQLNNLYLQIEREGRLIKIAEKKIRLARAVLKDETDNYSYGKVTLNEYIQAVNFLDNNRFNKVSHESLRNKLLNEWQRLTDQLVSRKDIF